MRWIKADQKEFVKWLWGVAGADPPAEVRWLYQRALVCRTFPAYKLHELRDGSAVEILRAMHLLDLAAQAQSRG